MSKLKSFMKDESIVKEGDKSKEFFILVEGKVGIFKGEKKINEFDKEGTILGELSMILHKPRTASMKALTPVSVLVIEGELDEIIRQYPEYSKKLIHSLAERLAEASRQL
jgi:CRP-like cAMP-binding protein